MLSILLHTQSDAVLGRACVYEGKGQIFYIYKYKIYIYTPGCSVHNLFAMLSSLAPADLSLYHRVDYPALTYSGRVALEMCC